jgi:predicted NUDIX family phosphoesterase
VQCGHRLLTFRRSYLSRAAEFLRGAKCIGFGGHVSAADNDIFSNRDGGLETCARRELSEELAFSAPDSRETRVSYAGASLFRNAPLECLGVLNDDSSEVGRRHLATVHRAWINDWSIAEALEKGEPSLRTLKWIECIV